jgi:hypothetical protein
MARYDPAAAKRAPEREDAFVAAVAPGFFFRSIRRHQHTKLDARGFGSVKTSLSALAFSRWPCVS